MARQLNRIYVEITNRCNLSCSFCPGTRRPPRTMAVPEFAALAPRLRLHTRYVYLHVMGEPLLHPGLGEILDCCEAHGLRVCLTTNGVLLPRRGALLAAHPALHKVSVSLHSAEGSGLPDLSGYLQGVWDFCAAAGMIRCLRLWNIGGAAERNREILDFLGSRLGFDPLSRPAGNGSWRLGDRFFLERAERFDWPDLTAPAGETQFCYALRRQAAVLADGTVVPCCLDHQGDIPLGNLLEAPLEEILSSPRAMALYDGFSRRRPAEDLCRRCGYARRFNL